MLELDKCPNCGAHPPMGLRCHPKFSVKVGVILGQYTDMVAYYAHDRESQMALVTFLQGAGQTVLGVEQWTGTRWEEVPC